MLIASNPERKLYWSDDLFVKLCSMGRDMSMEVRVEAFDSLGKIENVSEDVLLQTLSKRVLGITKEMGSLGQCPAEEFEISASSVAGVFVHGLEDEFFEVRKSACHSLRTLTMMSAEFSGKVLNLLMDVLNDDSVVVRLEALQTMLHMTTHGLLKVQGTHMHMFLGTLMDSSTSIRSASRKILKLVKLSSMESFRLSVGGLIENLERHPQDEPEIFCVMFHMGRNHGKFVVSIINEMSEEIEPTSEGKLDFDRERVAALLVLAISAPLSQKQNAFGIPPRIFSYAVTLLGRISVALTDVVDQDALLAYLFQSSRSTGFSASDFNFEANNTVETLFQKQKGASNILQSWATMEALEVASPLVRSQLGVHNELMKSMNLILEKVKDIWLLMQSGFAKEVLGSLRSFKEEVATFNSESVGSVGVVAFTMQYLRIMKQLAKVWEHFLPARNPRSSGMGGLDVILGKLDMRLRELRSRFTGFSLEQEVQILELILLTCTFRLCKVDICCHLATLEKLSATMSRVESILILGSFEPSNFVSEVGQLLCRIGSSSSGVSCNPFLFKDLVQYFSHKQFVFCGRLDHIVAELVFPNNDSENPLRFVPCLPVGIPCEIVLHNVSSENKLWLRMTMDDESTQFVFLDLNLFGGSEEVRNFTYVAPFYRTPNAASFTLRICIGMECLFEDFLSSKRYGGPKRELTYLCQERKVHLSMISEG